MVAGSLFEAHAHAFPVTPFPFYPATLTLALPRRSLSLSLSRVLGPWVLGPCLSSLKETALSEVER